MTLQLPPTLQNIEPRGLLGFIVLGSLCIIYFYLTRPALPLLNRKRPCEIRYIHVRKRFASNARAIIQSGLSKFSIFQINTENGRKTVLSPKYANEIRNHPDLDFGLASAREFFAHIRGFEPFNAANGADKLFQEVLRTKLTQSLGNLTKQLSEETTVALQKNWGDDSKWHSISPRATILQIVAQLSSKVFLGDQLCRNSDWLRIMVDYTVHSMLAVEELRLWPDFLRSFVANFLPSCRRVRADLHEAREIIIPILKKRKAEKSAAIKQGLFPERYNDAMEWTEECAKGRPYDAVTVQLSFSLGAIHTTSDMMTQALYDICGKRGLIDALRQEILDVLQEEGWKKTALYKLQLMDSTLKESQRLKPLSIVSMRRTPTKTVYLSDGSTIPKGNTVYVSNEQMWNPSIYPDPQAFDPYRFLKMREIPGNATHAQLVSPSPEHMGFGFGKHACPGRFFAANEIKIALCHVLLKYDFRFAPGCTPQVKRTGVSLFTDPKARMEIRRRREEIIL